MFKKKKKTIEEGNFSYDSPEMRAGEIVKIRIHERTKHALATKPLPRYDWFLIDADFNVDEVYSSDKMVENGEVTRLYKDPALGDYRVGNYLWLDGSQVEFLPTTNLAAKHLLSLNE